MGVFGRSWKLTRMSFGVIRQDKEMLFFPVIAGVLSTAFAFLLLFPTIIVGLLHDQGGEGSTAFGALEYALVFTVYLGLAFITTFFNVCVVFTAKTRFEGGDATFLDSIRFAFGRTHLILAWSLVSATVGVLLYMLDNVAERAGFIGKLLLGAVRGILGAMWSIVTLFVIPAMVYHDLGPFEAIRRSVQTLKSTWGESLVRHYGLGLIQFLFLLLGFGLAVVLFMALGSLGTVGIVIALGVTVAYFLGVILVFTVANNIFNTALYAYANGHPPSAFDAETLKNAFQAKA